MKSNSNYLYSGNLAFKKPYENDSSEDGYVSPQDISIKDEQVWDPTDEEIISYAAKLGYDIEKDPDELFEVAYYYMKYPLPEGWKRGIMKSTKELVYINLIDGEIEVSTEIEEMAHQMYLEKKAEMNQKNIFKKSPEKEKTTVVPRKKIPPLNPLQKSNNSNGIKGNLPSIKETNSNKKSNVNNINNVIEKNNILNNNKNIILNKDEEIIKLNQNIDKFLEKSLSEKTLKEMTNQNNKEKEKQKEKEKEKEKEKNKDNNLIKENYKIIKNQEKNLNIEIEDNQKKKDYLLYNLDNEEEEEELDEEEEDDILDKKSDKSDNDDKEDDFLEKMLKKDKELEALRKQKEKDIETVLSNNAELRKLVDIKNLNSEENDKKKELEKEKKNYLQKKLEELKEYKETVKIKYEDKKDKYEKEQKNKYEQKLKEEINNKKAKLKKQYEEKLELYEKQLINKKNKEEKKYKDELINVKNSKKEEDKEIIKKKREKEKADLKNKKEELLKELEKLKKIKNVNEANLSQKKFNLQKNIMLIDEKKNLDKKNKLKKNDLDIKNIEYQKEKEFNDIKNDLIKKHNEEKKKIISPNINREENLENTLLNDIQKAMNEEFEINKKEIEQELMNKKLKEIEKYTNNIINEKEEKIDLFKKEIISTEKDYYKSISDIRINFQKSKFNNENNLKLKFEETLSKYENTKKAILEEYKELTKHISDNLQKLIVGNYTLKQSERKFEEFLINLKDNYMIIYQKNKNNFDMYENDYIYKTQFIKYLLEVVNYMTKLFSNMKTQINDGNNSNDDYKNSQIELAGNLLKFCIDKIIEYSKKYNKNKNISVFSFMNGNVMKSQSFENSKINEFDDINETLKFDESSRRRNKRHKKSKDKILFNKNNIFSKEDINETINNSSNNESNELTFITIDKEQNMIIPTIPENIISNINIDISSLYSDITNFLKEEYIKILDIIKLEKEKGEKNKISTNLNLIILDKIKSFSEETFNYLLANYKKNEQQLNIKKKLRLILNHIQEYKNQFNLDKYLLKSRPIKEKNNYLNKEISFTNQMSFKNTLNHKYSFNNYISNNNDITNFAKTTYQTSKINKIEKNELEEQKQSNSIDEINISKSVNNNINYNTQLNGRFNNFFRQYSSNALAEEITNPNLFQFFNYKKNKYELDKSLGKLSMP